MSKPTKRVEGEIIIKFSATEDKAEFIVNVLTITAEAMKISEVPKLVNAKKGDYILTGFYWDYYGAE